MPIQPIEMPVLSDHAYQSRSFVALTDKGSLIPELSLNIGSWNIQDQCRSQATQGGLYANNPYNLDENFIGFANRKLKQIKKILEMIQFPNDRDDIILLQEIDFLTNRNCSHLKDNFEERLKNYGYELILSDRSNKSSGHTQQPMAIIYNKHKLTLVSGSQKGVFPSPPDARGIKKYRGFEATFRFKNPQSTEITITNLHLLYGHDYRTEIETYQKDKEQQGRFSIMGGDTNNVQNVQLNTALGHWNRATNFACDPITGELTTLHHNPNNLNTTVHKSYDCFFGVPPSGCYLKSQLTQRSEYVCIEEKKALFALVAEKDCRMSRSRVGERWRRGKDIVHELEQQYLQSNTSAEKDQILEKLDSVVQLKKLNAKTCFSNPTVQADYYRQYPQKLMPYEHYIHNRDRTSSPGRWHRFYAARQNGSTFTGDALKSEILDAFAHQLEQCKSIDDFNSTVQNIKNSSDYVILATGQDITTRLFGGLIKTSSVVAFEQLCQQKLNQLASLDGNRNLGPG